MFFEDHSLYSYSLPAPQTLPDVENVGWLDLEHPFSQMPSNESFLNKLRALIEREGVNVTRGTHKCQFCMENDVRLGNRLILLGHTEVWVPSSSRDIIFASPSLIYHYCDKHSYRPPDEFIESVMAFDLESAWSGSLEAEGRILAAHKKRHM